MAPMITLTPAVRELIDREIRDLDYRIGSNLGQMAYHRGEVARREAKVEEYRARLAGYKAILADAGVP